MTRRKLAFTLLVGGLVALPGLAVAQQHGDYGDAPEGAIAYPTLGVGGMFPTCLGGPAGFVFHAPSVDPLLLIGPLVDHEFDGNGGVCPQPPYDQDECGIGDGDCGILFPEPCTIMGGVVTTCSGVPAAPLGTVCNLASWGADIDIDVTNFTNQDGFFNVLVDWDQSGTWGGAAPCPTGPAPEWMLVNLPIPAGFSGPISMLGPPTFRIGPFPGKVWVRATISESPVVALDWDGSGFFELGESEDYLLTIKDDNTGQHLEYGDAPEDAVAYPSAGVIGFFPTCLAGPSGFISHMSSGTAYFGSSVDTETDGNAGVCPQPPYDQDECDIAGGDAGLMLPEPFTIVGGVEVPCPGVNGTPLGMLCQLIGWGPDIDIMVNNLTPQTMYFNTLIDWNQDGFWGGGVVACGAATPEHVVVDFPVPSGFVGPISGLAPPGFVAAAKDWVWARFTLSDTPVGLNWDGQGAFDEGETEDYLLFVLDPETAVPLGQQSNTEETSWTGVKELFRD